MLTWQVPDDQIPGADDLVARATAAQYLCGCLPGYGSRFEAIRDQAVYAALACGVPVQHLRRELNVTPAALWRMARQHVLMNLSDEGPARP